MGNVKLPVPEPAAAVGKTRATERKKLLSGIEIENPSFGSQMNESRSIKKLRRIEGGQDRNSLKVSWRKPECCFTSRSMSDRVRLHFTSPWGDSDIEGRENAAERLKDLHILLIRGAHYREDGCIRT